MPIDSVILIGMPGAGKSTVGVLLAKALRLGFVDTDLLIQTRFGRTLQEILDLEGYQALRAKEEQVLLDTTAAGYVVATGGSAVYSRAGMAHLTAQGPVVYLDVPLTALEQRLDNLATRGVARPADQSLEDLFAERTALYRQYAHVVVDANLETGDKVAGSVAARLRELGGQLT